MHITSKTHGTQIVYFDIEDFDKIKNYKWHINKTYNTYRVWAQIKRKTMYMHKIILNNEIKDIDHINGNGLDNRKCNLRACNKSQNGMNRGAPSSNTSGYKGVYYKKRDKKWVAFISVNGKHYNGGSFKDINMAAVKYNEMAIKYHGEYARLNEVINGS